MLLCWVKMLHAPFWAPRTGRFLAAKQLRSLPGPVRHICSQLGVPIGKRSEAACMQTPTRVDLDLRAPRPTCHHTHLQTHPPRVSTGPCVHPDAHEDAYIIENDFSLGIIQLNRSDEAGGVLLTEK